jgi:G3E family GTPase
MNDNPVRFLMIGGFLGAGKTTTIARLAQHYIDDGLRVGLVTNDQAYDLVDTLSLRSQGFDVGEVPGACFCCKFDDLISTVQSLCTEDRPDLIIAEPVGSCTDLVATVLEPMQAIYGEAFEPGRYAVLLKPEHGLKILRKDAIGFSEQAAYIFRKQLEEADLLVINKIDKLDDETLNELSSLVEAEFPNKSCLRISSKIGTGFENLMDQLSQAPEKRSFMDVDYDVYAEGEAELGWLNATVHWESAQPLAFNQVAVTVVADIQRQLAKADAEVAHLKVMAGDAKPASDGSNAAIANLVSTSGLAELSIDSAATSRQIKLTVNARVATGPDALESMVSEGIGQASASLGATSVVAKMQKLSPGRPVPTHRMPS